MPYIVSSRRLSLDARINALVDHIGADGELNYVLTKIIDKWSLKTTRDYSRLNSVMGVLSCVAQEFYRRVIAKYEEKKCDVNGDVYE